MSALPPVIGADRPISRTLYDMAQMLESSQNAEMRVRAVLTLLEEMLAYDQCVLLCAAEVVIPRMTALPPLEEGPTSEVIAALDRLLQSLSESDSTQVGASLLSSDTGVLSWASHLVVPLVALDEVIGILAVWRKVPDAFAETDVRLLSVVAAQLAAYLAGLAARHMLDRMLAGLAHELRNPLMSIYGMSELLQRRVGHVSEPARERFARGLKTIGTTAWSMTTQLNELLEYARAQTGRLPDLDGEPTDVVALLRQTVDEFQDSTERHTLALQTAEETIVVMVDPRQLERAIANLLANAIKFSPGGGQILVSVTRAVGPDGQWLSIVVADNGLGIPNADVPHLFEQYYRASNVVTTIPGSGIGLANVRQIVERHGGTITVDSAEGAGTTVTLRLPLVQAAVEPGGVEDQASAPALPADGTT